MLYTIAPIPVQTPFPAENIRPGFGITHPISETHALPIHHGGTAQNIHLWH
jgi:hypothetical protein